MTGPMTAPGRGMDGSEVPADPVPEATPGAAVVAGVLAALAALAAAELLAAVLPGNRSLVVAVGDRIIQLTPGGVARFAISTFGTANRAVLLLSMAVVVVGAGGLVGVTAARRRGIAPAGMAVFAALGVAAALSDPFVPTLTAVVAPTLGAVAGTLLLRWLLSTGPRPATIEESGADSLRGEGSRRAFLASAGTVLGATLVAAMTARTLLLREVTEAARRALRLPPPANPLPPPSATTVLDVDGVSPLVTPTADFYRIDTALTVPQIDPATHVLRVTGLVDRPFELGYDQLLELADTEADVTLSCVSNEVGGNLVGNARWQGVPLASLLERAGVQPAATQIIGRAVDGWTGGFPVEVAFDGRPALVAVGMNGRPLPPAHGFPVRLVVAGLYGYVSDTKWLREIELTTFEDVEAYWIPRGWARHGPIKTQSRIDVPRRGAPLSAGTIPIAGVAWAGIRGISAVEVSVDDGPWRRATLSGELATTSWRQWMVPWEAEPGRHTIRVRATDGEGQTQTARRTDPAPDGATGHHTLVVSVT